jgi:hypothetical protein
MLAGDLAKAGLPAISGPNQLVIRFSSGYNPQYQTCAEPARLARIQDALRLITAQPWVVRVEMDRSAPSNPVAMPQARAPATPVVPAADPLVAAVQSVFDARILKADDGFGQTPPAVEASAIDTDTELPDNDIEDD